MKRRPLRVASVIRSIVADALAGKLNDPRIAPLTSITRVELSPDFSSAHIHVSVMADAAAQKLTLQALQHASGRIRSMIAEQLSMRVVPWLTFHLDLSLQRSMHTIEAIDRAMAELEPHAPEALESTLALDALDDGRGDAPGPVAAAEET